MMVIFLRLRNVKNKKEILSDSILLIENPEEYRGKWKELFENTNPIYIEIGMGKGNFIFENALKYPDINFIGIEKYDSVIARAVQKIESGDTLPINEFKKSKPSQLSGGMRQRVALIRTLMLEPDLLLLDEPFSALDYQTRLSVADDVWKILKNENKTALLITHDISEAISMADRILVLSSRPATIQKEIPINLTCPSERTPFLSRSAPEFKDYFNQVWKELNHDE